jgi:hypothetical protein
MGSEPLRAEHIGKGAVANVEAAGISTECGHHQSDAVAREAAPGDADGARDDARYGVQVSRDLATGTAWLMAKSQTLDGNGIVKATAYSRGGTWIVVARDPNPIATAL